jgi:tRNA nucleotidyltransferase (CCA-adding enzyme)
MLRALRFKAVLGFEIEPLTYSAIKDCARLSARLSSERVRDELRKIMLSKSPETLETVIELGLLNSFLDPSPIELKGLSALTCDEDARWCAFCYELKRHGLIPTVAGFLNKLRFSGRAVSVISAAADILEAGLPQTIPDLKRLLRDRGAYAVSCAAAASGNAAFIELYEKTLLGGECFSLKELKLSGGDIEALGVNGRVVGTVLSALLEHVIENPGDNERNILLNLAKNQIKSTLT